jgi:lysophospholipase L1-like esterase
MMSRSLVTIAAIGDSTTAGTPGFLSPLEAPPTGSGDIESQYACWLMRRHGNWRVLNCGVNGERSDQIRSRFERDVLAAGADVVVIIAGVNDIYQGRQPGAVARELDAMFDAARHAHIPVVAGSILPYNTASAAANERMRVVNGWIHQYAQRHRQVTWCDTRAAVAAPDNPDYLAASPDGLHPSPDGYRLMALALEPAIKRALRLRSGQALLQ